MSLRGTSIGVIGALKAFPLRIALQKVTALGGRLHRGLPRGTQLVVLGHGLLSSATAAQIEKRVDAARATGANLISENGFLRLLGLLPAQPRSGLPATALIEQLADERGVALLSLFDAFEFDAEPYSFRDAILARKYRGLLASGAGWFDVARSVNAVGPVGSLTALSLQTRGARIVATDQHSELDLGGQRLLPLGNDADEAEDYFAHAEAAEAAGLSAEAARLYEHCAAIDSSDATAPFNQGNCLHALGDLSGASHAYAMALKRDPLFVEAWFNLGGVLRDLGRVEVARRHLAKAIALDPDYADAVYNLAALDYDAGNLGGAERGWRRYLELDDTSDWARRARAGLALIAHNERRRG
jgi:tetratricopeptide (TPR) repeat protein